MNRLLLISMSMICGAHIMAQATITVGTGTDSTVFAPIRTDMEYTYSQTIYPVADLISAGGTAGNITKIRFSYRSGLTANGTDWTIYLGHTVRNNFNNTNDWELYANLTQVYSGTVTYPAPGNWMEITLATPFAWNGTNNIVVAVDENQPGSSGGATRWNSTDGPITRSLTLWSNYTNPDPASLPVGGPPAIIRYLTASSPNIQLVINSTPCSGMPVHDTTIASLDTVCSGENVNFSVNNNVGPSGITYAWQINHGNGWTSLPGTTSGITAPITQAAQVRAIVTCTGSGQSDTTTSANVIVEPVVNLGNDTIICTGDSITLDAGHPSSTYVWSQGATSQTITVSTPGPYGVSVTDGAGCTGTDTINVSLAALPSGDGITMTGTYPNMIFSVDSPANAVTYNWSFGDSQSTASSGPTVPHAYAAPGSYLVTVVLLNQNGCDSVVLTRTVQVINIASVEDDHSLLFSMYPNPATSQVNLILNDYTNAQLTAYTVAGSVIHRTLLTAPSLDVSTWPAGIYFLKIDQGGRSALAKLVLKK